MAYTTIDNPELYFQTKIYTGTGSARSITLDGSEDMQPDWIWIKSRSNNASPGLFDSVRGATKLLSSTSTDAESTVTVELTSFNSDGFSLGDGSQGYTNQNSGRTYVAWNWKASGTAPAITYNVKVVSDSGNKYRFDDFGTSAVTLDLQEGGTYTFDQSDSSNSGHPLRFYTAADKSGGEYTTGVTTTGTAGSSGAKTVITVAASAPTLYYQCSNHAGMGGQVNTNSTFGSSNFSGSIQSTVSANTTAGFSIVTYTGTSSNSTVGHGLGSVPQVVIVKDRTNNIGNTNWNVYHAGNTSAPATDVLALNTTSATSDSNIYWNDTTPTSSVFSLGTAGQVNDSSDNYVAYCFAEKKGYSSFGSYQGNGNADGTFVYTGFKPAWLMIKQSSGAGNDWLMYDNKRDTSNVASTILLANATGAEQTGQSFNYIDLLSNGFKLRGSDARNNGSGGTMIYMAFAESPLVNSNGVPTNAR